MKGKTLQKETLCVHGTSFKENTGAVSVPIYQSATFTHPRLGESTGYDYSRLQNPTRQAVEETIAKLEKAKSAICFSSGMAAISCLMELFNIGDHIIASEDLYGGAIRLFRQINQKNGIKFSFVDTSDLNAITKAITKNTKAIFVESPTNPMMIVSDLKAIGNLANKNGLLFVVDNTFLTPHFITPISFNADIVVHSGTKYLGGHNDTLAGVLAFKDLELAETARAIAKTLGACLSPFDSWLLLRGIKTLALRMERANDNALKIAQFLSTHKKIKKVFYAGLSSHKGHNILKEQSSGFGAMVSFEVDSHETLKTILEKVKVFSFAESLGGVESLITYPAAQTHADVPEQERLARGINEKLMRASIGIENAKDLIDDLQNALL